MTQEMVSDEKVKSGASVSHVEDASETRYSLDVPAGAREASDEETHMGLLKALRMYPKAVGWSMMLSTALVMEGFDMVLIGSFYAQDQFNRQFGEYDSLKGIYQVSAAWQSGLSNAPNCGAVIGLLLTGWLSERYGYRLSMMGALIALTGFIFISFFAKNLATLLVGELLMGIPWGVFQTMTTAYASDVTPVVLRPYLTTYVNLCWVFGQLIASGVLRGTLGREGQWAWRIPLGLQWMWPIPLIIGCYFAPDSPWWLVRKERLSDARHAIRRLSTRSMASDHYIENQIAMIVHTNELEKELSSGVSYLDCFKNTDLRRTEIAVCVWLTQSLSGSALMGYSTYFFLQAGLSQSYSFDLSIANYGIGVIGTVLSWFLMIYFGRRTLYLLGILSEILVLFAAGFMGIPELNSSLSWGIGAMLLIFTFCYDATIGPICYSLVAEIPTTRLKSKTMVIARAAYIVANIVTSVITPHMLNPLSWNWKSKCGFFYGGLAVLCFVYCYFRLPEPKGRTYAELDVLFEQHTPARKFKGRDINPFLTHGQLGEKPELSSLQEYLKQP